MSKWFDPPLAIIGKHPDERTSTLHAFLSTKHPSFCAIYPPGNWKPLRALVTRPWPGKEEKRVCPICRLGLLEAAVMRSIQRLGSPVVLDDLLDDIPAVRPLEGDVSRALRILVGRGELECEVLAGSYPNKLAFHMPESALRKPWWQWGTHYGLARER